MLNGDRRLAVRDLLGALDARLDDVEVGDAQAIQLRRHVAEGCGWIAVRHGSVGAARRDTHAHTIGAPTGDGRLRHLEQEARAVFDRAAVLVPALVGPVLQELIRQIAVGAVNLDAVEASPQRPLGADAKLLDDSRDLMEFECARHRERGFAVLSVGVALGRNRRRRDRRFAVRLQVDMRLPADMPQLLKDAAALGVDRVGHAPPSQDLSI